MTALARVHWLALCAGLAAAPLILAGCTEQCRCLPRFVDAGPDADVR